MLRPLSSSTFLLEEQHFVENTLYGIFYRTQFYHANAVFARKKSLPEHFLAAEYGILDVSGSYSISNRRWN
jgi:hypothetical protein